MATQVTVITGEGSTTYSVSTGARGPAGPAGAGGGGSVTNVATGTGLTGGPVTTTGTIALANTAVVAGIYTAPHITVDAQGRATSVVDALFDSELTVTGIASLNAPLATATSIVEYDTPIAGSVHTGDYSTVTTGEQIVLYKPTGFILVSPGITNLVKTSSTSANNTFNLITSEIISQSADKVVLRWTGTLTKTGSQTKNAIAIATLLTAGGNLATFVIRIQVDKERLYTGTSPIVISDSRAISLAATTSAGTYATPSSITVDATGRVTAATAGAGAGSGTVQSITAGTGLSGGTITTTGTIALNNTEVTAAAYTNANITVDAQGRITAAANGSAAGNVTGTAPIVVTSGVVSLDTTLPNAYAFTSTTRPTSSGTGTPAATSLLKRDDVDRRYLSALRSVNLDAWSLWGNTATTGASSTANVGYLELRGGNGSSAGAVLAFNNAGRNHCGIAPTSAFAGIDFANKVNCNFAFFTRNWADFTSLNWAFIFGDCETATFTGIADRIKTGTNTDRGWVGLRCVAGSVTIVAVNGTSTVRESAQIDTCSNSTVNNKGYRLEISGGIITVFNTLGIVLGTLGTGASDGAPTTSKVFNINAMVQSSVTTNQIGIIVQHVSFDW